LKHRGAADLVRSSRRKRDPRNKTLFEWIISPGKLPKRDPRNNTKAKKINGKSLLVSQKVQKSVASSKKRNDQNEQMKNGK
jgi:hypothetical protein